MPKDHLANQLGEADVFRSKAGKLQAFLEAGVQSSHRKCVEATATIPDNSIEPTEIEAQAYLGRVETAYITCLYIRAALIYLHITLHGTNSMALPDTKRSVFEWTFSFRFVPDHTWLSKLVWPLCIVGSMATTAKQQQFFHETITSPGIDRHSPCMIWQVLDIMERCWKKNTSDSI